MRKTLTLVLAVALFGILAAVVVAQGGDEPAPSATTATTETTETTESAPTVTTPERTTPEPTTTTEDNPERVGTDSSPGVDISGPCDEAEHAGDPRCNGAVAGEDRDDSRGSGRSGGGEDDDWGDDSSGHGGGDDSSGSGHSGGGEDDDWGDDSSGHGGGDDD